MAKETMIVFVYDSDCLQNEADDPVSAVLYFHPSWVSDTQKVALCGQLMGTSFFLKNCFFKPRIIALQNGKFVLKEFGRFILAVGTDRNISDYLLLHRSDLLSSLVQFFHRDLQTIYDQFSATTVQYKNLSEKLYQIFETYLPILQYNGNIFQNVTKLRIPKTASNIFLDAIQTLQCCQQTKGILGGAILYHNKVVASQLSESITKHLVIADPLHIRTTAEQLSSTAFHIPNGVQMMAVYIDGHEFRQLAADAHRAQHLQTTHLTQQGPLTFQYAKRKMKRDKSLIFTNIPEEGSGSGSGSGAGKAPVGSDDSSDTFSKTKEPPPTSQPPPQRPKSLLMRPTHLPLRLKSVPAKELPESGIASINFDETDSYPEFIGRTSVCSTPMAENKVLHVGNIMSICANPEDENNSNSKLTPSASSSTSASNRPRNSLKIDFDKFFQHFITNPNKQLERRNSFTDLQDSLKKISKKLSLKQFSNNFKTDVNRNGGGSGGGDSSMETPDFIENDDDADEGEGGENSDDSDENNKTLRTITDPTYPVFNANGQPVSRSLFQEFLEKYYKLWDDASDEAKKDAEIAQLIAEFKEFDEELKRLDASLRERDDEEKGRKRKTLTTTTAAAIDSNLNVKEDVVAVRVSQTVKTPADKKTMSLPLKPMSVDLGTPTGDNGVAATGLNRRPSGGVPLTPLMAKLSVLAMSEDRGNRDITTPGGIVGAVEIQTPIYSTKNFATRRNSSLRCDDAVDALATLPAADVSIDADVNRKTSRDDGLQRVELYVCGQQNMTLLLLMEEGASRQQAIVQKMFEICVAKFPHMESHLSQTLNVNVAGDKREGAFSFICIDSKWDALQRSGPWNPGELNTLECMHRDLQSTGLITDLIIRSSDSVSYGYKSGRTELFYKEAAHHIAGIPPPSDPVGSIAMRARTRLERDHSHVLF